MGVGTEVEDAVGLMARRLEAQPAKTKAIRNIKVKFERIMLRDTPMFLQPLFADDGFFMEGLSYELSATGYLRSFEERIFKSLSNS